jgi:hypothetical protein
MRSPLYASFDLIGSASTSLSHASMESNYDLEVEARHGEVVIESGSAPES